MTNSSALNLLNLSSTAFNQNSGNASQTSETSSNDSFLSLLTQQLTFSAGNGSSAFNSKTSSVAAFSPGAASSRRNLRPSFSDSNMLSRKKTDSFSERWDPSNSFSNKIKESPKNDSTIKVESEKGIDRKESDDEIDNDNKSLARENAEKTYGELIENPEVANFLQGIDKETAIDLIEAIQTAPEAEIAEILSNPEAIMEELTAIMEDSSKIDEDEMSQILTAISSPEAMTSLSNMLEKSRPEIAQKLSKEQQDQSSVEGMATDSLKQVEDQAENDSISSESKTENSENEQTQEKKAENSKAKEFQTEQKVEASNANQEEGTLKYREEKVQNENSAVESEMSLSDQTVSDSKNPETKVSDSFQSELANMLTANDSPEDSLKKKLVSALLQKANNGKSSVDGAEGEATYSPKTIANNKSSFFNQNGNQGFGNGGNANGAEGTAGSPAESKSTGSLANSVFAQLLEKAELIKASDGKKVLNIELDPKDLGKMEMELTSKDGTVSAKISAENSDVKSQLDELLPKIKEQLNEQGINLVEITVDISSKHPDEKNRNKMFEGKQKSISGSKFGSDDGEELIRKNVLPHLRRRALNIQAIDLTV